jgi:cyclin D1/2/4, plant
VSLYQIGVYHATVSSYYKEMAPSSYEMAASILLCAEDSSSLMVFGAEEEEQEALAQRTRSGELAAAFPTPSEECVARLLESETEHMPREGYAERLRAGGVDLRVRTDAIDWIWKVSSRSMQAV